MRAQCLALALLLLLALHGCRRQPAAHDDPLVRSAVALLQSGTVEKMEVLYFDRRALTRAAIPPERLERIYQRKLTVEHFDRSEWKDDLIGALRAHDMTRGSFPYPDCRWGCIFYDAKRARVFTMYFNGPGWRGLIGGTPVEVKRPSDKLKVVSLLEKRCLPRWE